MKFTCQEIQILFKSLKVFQLIKEQNLAKLLADIKRLKPHYQKVIHLRYFQELSYKEMAAQLNEPMNNIKVKLLRAKNYETLGNMNFDVSLYRDAGAYFDSTMTNLVVNSKPYRVIKKKRDNLDDVIYYEDIAQVNDSILHLVNMPEAERLAFFQEFADDLKAAAVPISHDNQNTNFEDCVRGPSSCDVFVTTYCT